jgi:endonuclease/exonuclease/phosphatase family metal-dependent hydrolase
MKKSKSRLPWFDKLLLYINCGLCLALLIGYLAPVTDPRKIWIIAFFGLAYPPVLLANVIMIVYWLLRKSRWALLSIIGIGIGWNVLLNNIGFSLSPDANVPPGLNGIRVMTYNVHSFKKYGSKKDISTKHEILEVIKKQQPDVIGIQEFYTRKRGQFAMLDSIKKLTGASHCYFEIFSSNADEAMGMVIFSKYPILSKGFIHLSPEQGSGNQSLYIDVKKNDRIFRVYSMHLQSINFQPQDYKYLDTVSKSGKADLSSTKRVGAKLKQAFLKRSEQVLKIKEHAKQCPYPYIISGDFNDTPSSFAVSQMSSGLKNTFREKGFGLGRTYNGDFPNYQIDYIMASPQFNVWGYHIIQKKLSDHYPVCANLELM